MVTDEHVKEKILSILMNDSRKSFRAIAKELNISTTTVSRIVSEFEKNGTILGYTTLIDWRKIDYNSPLCLQLNVASGADIDQVGNELREINAIKQVFYTTGDATFSAYAICKDAQDATTLLEELRKMTGVERVIPHTVLKIF